MAAAIVLVDDEPENLIFLQKVLKQYPFESFTNPLEAYEFIQKNKSVVMLITDQKMPELSGIDLVKMVNSTQRDILSIIISAYTDPDDLVDAVNSRLIYKYIIKPYKPDLLRELVGEALLLQPVQRAVRFKEGRELGPDEPFSSFLTICESGQSLLEKASFYSQSDSPLFIHGETGTGKEVLARAIHKHSPRCNGPFVAVNCAALSKELFLSELFGYRKGAFSGAEGNKKGFVHRADGGILFLDEISEIALEHQASLLRFIQYSTFYPVGSSEEEKADVRIISASHIHLKNLKKRKEFREDLYYRLSSLDLFIPPLRERIDDIALLFLYYCEEFSIDYKSIDKNVWPYLLNYDWSGNVRQLIYSCEKSSIIMKMNNETTITVDMLKDIFDEDIDDSRISPWSAEEAIQDVPTDEILEPIDLTRHLNDIEREYIAKYLTANNNNISRTAESLGLSRQGLKNKLRRHFVNSFGK